MRNLLKSRGGFTLIEILVVIGIIAILAAVVLVAINPARQFAQARDSQRNSNVNAILNAISQRMADNKGVFEGQFKVAGEEYICGKLPSTSSSISIDPATDSSTVSINPTKLGCLIPTYISDFPTDPSSSSLPDTGYEVYVDDGGRVHVLAPTPEPSLTREDPIEIVR